MERAHEPDSHFEPVTFDLAKGTKVRVAMGEFWEQLSESDKRSGSQPTLYFAIRIYSDEDTYPRRLTHHTEFRGGNDFDQCATHRLWTWLTALAASRHRFAYDSVEDFMEEFTARMEEFSIIGEDAADYFHKTHGTKPPLPYEDPPHAEFPEDEFAGAAREDDDDVEKANDDGTDDAETVLGEDDEGGENPQDGEDDAEEAGDAGTRDVETVLGENDEGGENDGNEADDAPNDENDKERNL